MHSLRALRIIPSRHTYASRYKSGSERVSKTRLVAGLLACLCFWYSQVYGNESITAERTAALSAGLDFNIEDTTSGQDTSGEVFGSLDYSLYKYSGNQTNLTIGLARIGPSTLAA